MKLMELLTQPENLLAAWRAIRGNIPQKRRERSAGPDGISLAEYERDLAANLAGLRDELVCGAYQPTPPARIEMPKRDGGRRIIGILTAKDRIAQRAAHQVLEPLFEPLFLASSFGFRPGRSTEQALAYAVELRRGGLRWVVDGDITDCFGTLDHKLLMILLARRVKDRAFLELVWAWLCAGVMPAGPPSPDDDLPPGWWRLFKGGTQAGLNWTLEALLAQSGSLLPATPPNWSTESDYQADAYYAPQNPPEDLKQELLKRLVVGGIALSLSGARSAAGSAVRVTGEALRTPHGRHLLRRRALTTGGIIGTTALAAAGIVAFSQRRSEGPAGTLQGSPLSPLLANVYLHPFDQYMAQHKHQLVRYADDWLILCPDARTTENAYEDAINCLGKLKLKINPVKTRLLSPQEPVSFLGGQIKAVQK